MIFQPFLRLWLDADQATGHYPKQWWLLYWRICASLDLNELVKRGARRRNCKTLQKWVIDLKVRLEIFLRLQFPRSVLWKLFELAGFFYFQEGWTTELCETRWLVLNNTIEVSFYPPQILSNGNIVPLTKMTCIHQKEGVTDYSCRRTMVMRK